MRYELASLCLTSEVMKADPFGGVQKEPIVIEQAKSTLDFPRALQIILNSCLHIYMGAILMQNDIEKQCLQQKCEDGFG